MMDLEAGKYFIFENTKDLAHGRIFSYTVQNVLDAEMYVLHDLKKCARFIFTDLSIVRVIRAIG